MREVGTRAKDYPPGFMHLYHCDGTYAGSYRWTVSQPRVTS